MFRIQIVVLGLFFFRLYGRRLSIATADLMKKSIYTDEYNKVTNLLVETRKNAKITQVELAEMLGRTQSFVSKVERGENRLDLLQLRTILHTLDSTLPAFVDELEKRLPKPKKKR